MWKSTHAYPKSFLIHRQTIQRITLKPKFECLNEIIFLCGTSEMDPERKLLKIGSFSAFSCKHGFLWGDMWKSTHANPKYFLIQRQTIHMITLKPKFGCLNEIISLCGTSKMAPQQKSFKFGWMQFAIFMYFLSTTVTNLWNLHQNHFLSLNY